MSLSGSTTPTPGGISMEHLAMAAQKAAQVASARITRDRLKDQVPYYREIVSRLQIAAKPEPPRDEAMQIHHMINLQRIMMSAYAGQLADMTDTMQTQLENTEKFLAAAESPIIK